MRRTAAFVAFALLLGSVALSGCSFLGFGGPNAESPDYLTSKKYTKLVIEVDYQNDKAPRETAIDLIKQRINERCNKPDGVEVTKTAFSSDRSTWSTGDLRSVEEDQRTAKTGGTTLVLHILYLAGHSDQDTSSGKVLGVAFGPTMIAMFKDTIDSSSGGVGVIPLFSTADIERSVLIHEFGHMLGLVNNGIKMVNPHEMTQDPEPNTPQNEGARHSNNKDSVMYWAIESSAITRLFSGPPPTQFDANDIADLRAAGGK